MVSIHNIMGEVSTLGRPTLVHVRMSEHIYMSGPLRVKFPVFPGDIITVNFGSDNRACAVFFVVFVDEPEEPQFDEDFPAQFVTVVSRNAIKRYDVSPDTFDVVTVARVE